MDVAANYYELPVAAFSVSDIDSGHQREFVTFSFIQPNTE
jgi:hypothetical protein